MRSLCKDTIRHCITIEAAPHCILHQFFICAFSWMWNSIHKAGNVVNKGAHKIVLLLQIDVSSFSMGNITLYWIQGHQEGVIPKRREIKFDVIDLPKWNSHIFSQSWSLKMDDHMSNMKWDWRRDNYMIRCHGAFLVKPATWRNYNASPIFNCNMEIQMKQMEW
jgi:hypothetical protein